jgi:hypothetical protein
MSGLGRVCLRLSFVLGALGCAAQKPVASLPAIAADLHTPSDANAPASGSGERDDLATAFDPPSNATARPLASTPGGDASSQPADPAAENKLRFANRMTEARRCVTTRSAGDCQAMLDELGALADALDPASQQQVVELRYRFALISKDFKLASTVAHRWLLSCGPKAPDACRKRVISALDRALRQLPRKSEDELPRIRQSDSCVITAEARPKSSERFPDCAEAAMALYRKRGDKLMVSRLLLAKGRWLEADPRQASQGAKLFNQSYKSCDEPRCVDVRRRALKSLWALHLRLSEPELAARAAFAEMRLEFEDLPAERRAYARTVEVERACKALDEREGTGACRRLEKKLLGMYTFHDFSERASTRQGLSVDDVRLVNQHFQVLIEDCLASEASHIEQPGSVIYHLRWIALNDGRVDQVTFDRREQDQGTLADCIRKQFAVWRYPRYRGEYQHIDQEFTITRRERKLAAGPSTDPPGSAR